MNTRTTCLAALVLAIGATLAAQTPGSCGVAKSTYVNWPQFHSDVCHTGYNASEFILSPATVGNLVLDWKYNTGIEIDLSSPAVANGVVYIGDEYQGFYALNAATGAERPQRGGGVDACGSQWGGLLCQRQRPFC